MFDRGLGLVRVSPEKYGGWQVVWSHALHKPHFTIGVSLAMISQGSAVTCLHPWNLLLAFTPAHNSTKALNHKHPPYRIA